MLKDRGTKKWQGFFMPEHVAGVKEEMENQNKIQQPILDEDKIAEIELIIHEAMEYNLLLRYKFFKDGYIKSFTGRTVFIDYLKKEFRVQEDESIRYLPFHNLVDVERA